MTHIWQEELCAVMQAMRPMVVATEIQAWFFSSLSLKTKELM
jgi:hypothetical protein